MTILEQFEAKAAEYQELIKQIVALEAGIIRSEMKRRKNNVTGEIVVLHQQLIAAELESGHPQEVPRLPFG